MTPQLRPGSNQCECGECGQFFNTVNTFDMHRTGDYSDGTRRCLTGDEMRARGWRVNPHGFWIRGEQFTFPGMDGSESAA
jgi:hypothetical protein